MLALEPALIRSIFSGDSAEVRALLEEGDEGGDINYVDNDKRSPLHAAAFRGDAEIMELLITVGGGRVNIKDNKWLTPLHRACAAKVLQGGDIPKRQKYFCSISGFVCGGNPARASRRC